VTTLPELLVPETPGAWGFVLVAAAGWDGTDELRRAARLT